MNRPIRVLIAKPGLDGHDRGAKVVARALRDAGMEVVYTGLRQSAEAIVSAAVQEDVDAVGLSVLSGAHLQHFGDVIDRLCAAGAEDVLVFGGGIVPDGDRSTLQRMGVGEVFGPGSPTSVMVAYLQREVPRQRELAHQRELAQQRELAHQRALARQRTLAQLPETEAGS